MIAGHRASLVFLVHFEYTLARLPEVERINQLPCYYSTQLICNVKLITKRANDVTIINEKSKGIMSRVALLIKGSATRIRVLKVLVRPSIYNNFIIAYIIKKV